MSNFIEEFKDIIGYEGYYQVSNKGRIKSLGNDKNRKEKYLKPTKDGDNYLRVGLHKDGKQKTCHIHRLVAEAFIPNPDNLPTVDHIDRNLSNNTVENLRWADMKMQAENKCEWDRTNQVKSRSIPVSQYTNSGEFIATYPSSREAERKTGVANQSITACIKGRLNSAGNYVWRYAS